MMDKFLHFIVCENLVMALAIAGRFAGLGNWAYIPAILLTAGAALGKELHDRKTTGFDNMDLVADFLGLFAGLVFVSLAATI